MIIEGKFFLFLIETICCGPSSEPSEMVQMTGHNICFNVELTRIINEYSLLSRALVYALLCLQIQLFSVLVLKAVINMCDRYQ